MTATPGDSPHVGISKNASAVDILEDRAGRNPASPNPIPKVDYYNDSS